MTESPEAPFLRWPKVLRRWTPRAIYYRFRLPHRRRRWTQRDAGLTLAYRRDAGARPARPNPDTASGLCACAIGDFGGHTGLSRAALYELERLRALHPELEEHDVGAVIAGKAETVRLEGPPIDILYLLSAPDTYGAALPCLPPERIVRSWRIGLWVWETPNFPARWGFAVPLVDEIWTPSEFSRAALQKGVGDIPVVLRPHAVRIDPPDHDEARRWLLERFDLPEDVFVGAAIMDVSACPARKNPWAHVAAWQAAFGDDPGVHLILKLRTMRRTQIVLTELREMIGAAGNIHLLCDELPWEHVARIQTGADVYLSLHRAEGYGLNIHECLASGIPVIATDFSANSEYGPSFSGYIGLPYRAVPYKDWTGHFADGDFYWAEADIAEAARELRALRAKAGRRTAGHDTGAVDTGGRDRAGAAPGP